MLMRPASAKQIDAGLALLRVITGTVFAVHGYQKFFMMGLGETGFFGSLGIPMAELAAPLIATLALAGPGSPSLDRMLGGRNTNARR